MSIKKEVLERSKYSCELCTSTESIFVFIVEPKTGIYAEEALTMCQNCSDQINGFKPHDTNHWRLLNDTIWSDVPAVKVICYRLLHELKAEIWPLELLEMMYLDDETLEWAKATLDDAIDVPHLDSNGALLRNGDTVTLIKDLDVKGANFTAKRGTAVRNIRLAHDNPEHIEGKINGQGIVILTQYVKK